MNFLKNKKGFTLTELLISMVVTLLILLTVSSVFIINQRVFRAGNTKAELLQNARLIIDLVSREIRQTEELVTVLPPDNSNPALVAHELEFEDGHTESQIQYIKYYLDGTDLKKQIKVYYFETNPTIYVHFNDTDPFGPPVYTILEDKLIGEFFNEIDFYGDDNITIDLTLQKNDKQIEMQSIINPRNI